MLPCDMVVDRGDAERPKEVPCLGEIVGRSLHFLALLSGPPEDDQRNESERDVGKPGRKDGIESPGVSEGLCEFLDGQVDERDGQSNGESDGLPAATPHGGNRDPDED